MIRGNSSFLRSGTPLTYGLMALAILSFLVVFSISGSDSLRTFSANVGFDPRSFGSRPWTLVTYPLLGTDPIATLFILIGLYFFSTSLERSWGYRRLGLFLLGLTVFTGLCAILAQAVVSSTMLLGSLGLPVAYIIVAWATLNPRAKVLVYGVLPIEARWIGWFTAAAVVFGFSFGAPATAIFFALPFVATWAYAAGKLRLPQHTARRSRGDSRGDYAGTNWERRRESERERQKLRELFERSWNDDDDLPGRGAG